VKHNLEQSGPFIGVGGLAVAAFLYGYSAFALPGLVNSVLLPLLWLVLLVIATRWFTRHPVWTVALPVVAFVVWFAVMLS
jgi:MFS superfamily sulfate permease-like transporter